jgi:hypothetical protein
VAAPLPGLVAETNYQSDQFCYWASAGMESIGLPWAQLAQTLTICLYNLTQIQSPSFYDTGYSLRSNS